MKTKLTLLIFLLTLSCNKKEEKPKVPTYSVKEAKVKKQDAPIYLDNIGHVESITSIKITSRVEGELLDVHFKEGDIVNEGDLLLTIDPRPYEATLKKTKGVLEENKANLFMAKDKFLRNESLIKDDYISQLDFEELATNVSRIEALIKQNKADIEQAKLNINYCHIHAPVSGKMGILQVDKGNMIYPDSQDYIVILNQIEPIYAVFFMPERQLPRIQKYAKENALKVRVAFEDLSENYIEGTLDLIDNQVDKQTGMIKLRAVFDNKNNLLWPGKFVKVRLILTTQKDALLVPFQSVVSTTDGPKIFIIKQNNTVEMRSVTLGQREDDNIIILKGVQEGEKVVLTGQQNLMDGSKISITTGGK